MVNMDGEFIALRWNNHLSTIYQLLSSLREEETLVDVTLACDGKLFSAHKFVLAMCSDYFKEMLTSNPCKHPIVYMKDVKAEDMESLLDFMYKGVVHIPHTALSALLKTAEGLQIRGLGTFSRENTDVTTPTGYSESPLGTTPERSKRTYDQEPHSEDTSFVPFSDEGEDDQLGKMPGTVKRCKASPEEHTGPPVPIPELPRLPNDKLDIGGGVSIAAGDYFKLRRTTANRYVNDLLRYFFPVEVLAHSSLTGGECFANKDKGPPSNKNQLDPCLIRIITHDAMRNFPTMNEKQVRTAIRRKLNTESRLFRGLANSGRRYKPRTPQTKVTSEGPRAVVSIERSDRDRDHGSASMMSVLPIVTVEKTTGKDVARRGAGGGAGWYATLSPGMSSEGKRGEDSDTALGGYFARQLENPHRSTPSVAGVEIHPQHTPDHPNEGSTSPPSDAMDKSPFKLSPEDHLVKTELAASQQYLPQEYSYLPPHMTPQSYLPHHMASADPAYLRRLEMTQSTALSYYPHSGLPTADTMEPSLHM